ncbi:protein kinase [Cyanobacteria bacterium FACHB-472]|nr:protein kinase [Cyanobacteria bacterium FACHB-472]
MMPLYCTKGHENPTDCRFCQHCGEPLPEFVSNNIVTGMILGDRYRIVRELGHGGFGRTYLAEDLNRFNEPCVLKEFAPKVQGAYALQKAEELFEREAGVLYKLRHSQIPNFREMFRVNQQSKGYLFLVQDYVEGQTYRSLLDARKSQGLGFSEGEVRQILLHILPVLEYIHSLGVIHRDISPENMILRSSDQLPVLIDFGGVKEVAATVESQFTLGSSNSQPLIATRLGKRGYAPDEQMDKGLVFPNSDLYALAASLLVLLTLKQPHEIIDSETLKWNWRREINLSPMLGDVLDKMLSRRISDRYQSAREVLQALSVNIPSTELPPTQPPAPPPIEPTQAVSPPSYRPHQPPIAHLHAQPSHQQKGEALTAKPQPTIPKRQSPFVGILGKILLVALVITGATGLGWWAGNLWIQSMTGSEDKGSDSNSSDNSTAPTDQENPSPQYSAAERDRKQQLRDRRISLGVDYNFYVNWVNETFWTQNPEQRGKILGDGSEFEQLRLSWDQTAAQLLDKLEQANLSGASRQRLGSYQPEDRDRFKEQVNQLRLSSRALYDLADVVFFQLFPEQRGKDFLAQPIGQVWHAIVAEKVKALQAGDALETIRFDPGAVGKRVRGTLKPREGKAFIANFNKDQLLALTFTNNPKLRLSLYPPTTAVPPLLEDSTQTTWSGKLPQSGYYEFVVISENSEPVDYQLDLGVETPAATPSTSTAPQ